MEKETLLLNKEEATLHAALGLIGLGLPQHYAITLVKLDHLIKEKGIGNVTVDDAVKIKADTDIEWGRRCDDPKVIKWE